MKSERKLEFFIAFGLINFVLIMLVISSVLFIIHISISSLHLPFSLSGVCILEGLVQHPEDKEDHNLPLMLWYAAEPMVKLDAKRAMDTSITTHFTIYNKKSRCNWLKRI